MATNRTVRVIRTWEKEVPAEYGDTDEMLVGKVDEEWLDASEPASETRVILEAFDSSYDTRQQLVCADCTESSICPVHTEDPYAEPTTDEPATPEEA